jgi:hypothetical protein
MGRSPRDFETAHRRGCRSASVAEFLGLLSTYPRNVSATELYYLRPFLTTN